jgi:hypothetical protein
MKTFFAVVGGIALLILLLSSSAAGGGLCLRGIGCISAGSGGQPGIQASTEPTVTIHAPPSSPFP